MSEWDFLWDLSGQELKDAMVSGGTAADWAYVAMYSDNWLNQGCSSGDRIKVSDTVDYRVWSDNEGTAVGVIVDFETADDFHYELLIENWHKFLKEVLSIADITASTEAFRNFLVNNKELFAFEDSLDSHGIEFKKAAFY